MNRLASNCELIFLCLLLSVILEPYTDSGEKWANTVNFRPVHFDINYIYRTFAIDLINLYSVVWKS